MDMRYMTAEFLAEFDTIICLAAHSSVPMASIDPRGAIQNNVVNLERLIQLLLPNQRLIYASSASVYGNDRIDAAEDQESYGMFNTYDVTKQVADDIAKRYIAEGKQIIGLRFGTICGISPNTRSDLSLNNMILSARRQGSFWISNPQIHRSFLSVDDAVDAIITLISNDVFTSGIYNLKSFDSTIEGIANNMRDITNIDYETRDPTANSYDFTISINKISQQYGWKPNTKIDELIESIYASIASVPSNRRDDLGKISHYDPTSPF
jgi:nucleoside-diphosphate-sugar epimerase